MSMTSAVGATTPGSTQRAPATVHITDAGCRLHVRVTHPDRAAQDDARMSFRSCFPRHGDRTWLHGEHCWSTPLFNRGKIENWAFSNGFTIVEKYEREAL